MAHPVVVLPLLPCRRLALPVLRRMALPVLRRMALPVLPVLPAHNRAVPQRPGQAQPVLLVVVRQTMGGVVIPTRVNLAKTPVAHGRRLVETKDPPERLLPQAGHHHRDNSNKLANNKPVGDTRGANNKPVGNNKPDTHGVNNRLANNNKPVVNNKLDSLGVAISRLANNNKPVGNNKVASILANSKQAVNKPGVNKLDSLGVVVSRLANNNKPGVNNKLDTRGVNNRLANNNKPVVNNKLDSLGMVINKVGSNNKLGALGIKISRIRMVETEANSGNNETYGRDKQQILKLTT